MTICMTICNSDAELSKRNRNGMEVWLEDKRVLIGLAREKLRLSVCLLLGAFLALESWKGKAFTSEASFLLQDQGLRRRRRTRSLARGTAHFSFDLRKQTGNFFCVCVVIVVLKPTRLVFLSHHLESFSIKTISTFLGFVSRVVAGGTASIRWCLSRIFQQLGRWHVRFFSSRFLFVWSLLLPNESRRTSRMTKRFDNAPISRQKGLFMTWQLHAANTLRWVFLDRLWIRLDNVETWQFFSKQIC